MFWIAANGLPYWSSVPQLETDTPAPDRANETDAWDVATATWVPFTPALSDQLKQAMMQCLAANIADIPGSALNTMMVLQRQLQATVDNLRALGLAEVLVQTKFKEAALPIIQGFDTASLPSAVQQLQQQMIQQVS